MKKEDFDEENHQADVSHVLHVRCPLPKCCLERRAERQKRSQQKCGFVLADCLYNLQREQNEGNSECDVLGAEVMKERAKVLGNIVKPEAHAHMFFQVSCPLFGKML